MSNGDGTSWASDTPVSMPRPPEDDVVVDMGAHGFTLNGLVHNITKADLDDYLIPTFSPAGTLGNG